MVDVCTELHGDGCRNCGVSLALGASHTHTCWACPPQPAHCPAPREGLPETRPQWSPATFTS
jgi:hypothetical protein